jgi:hypothetical protein
MAYYRAVARADTAAAPERIGVLLVNLGTPDAPSYFAVQRYLREFLGDRRVIFEPRESTARFGCARGRPWRCIPRA